PAGGSIRRDMAGATTKADVNGEKTLHIPLPLLEVDPSMNGLRRTMTMNPPEIVLPGARTSHFRILRQDHANHKLALTIEGQAGTGGAVELVRHAQFVPHLERNKDGTTSYGSILLAGSALNDSTLPIMLGFNF